jgi:hypothetical protein
VGADKRFRARRRSRDYLSAVDLIGCNLLLQGGQMLLDKFFCMERARAGARCRSRHAKVSGLRSLGGSDEGH